MCAGRRRHISSAAPWMNVWLNAKKHPQTRWGRQQAAGSTKTHDRHKTHNIHSALPPPPAPPPSAFPLWDMWQQTCTVCWASTGSKQNGKKKTKTNLPTQNKAVKWTAWPCVYLLRGPQPGIQRRDVFFEEGVDCWEGGKWPGSLLLNNIQNKQKGPWKQQTLPAPQLLSLLRATCVLWN